MNSLSSIASSGLNAAQANLNSSAQNIANLGTEGFRRQETVQTTQTGGGVQASYRQASTTGNALEADVVNQMQAKHSYMANLAVFKTSNAMTGALLDIKA